MISRDNCNYTVVHCTGYIKNWPPQMDRPGHHGGHHPHEDPSLGGSSSCCLVAIGRLQVTSMPNSHDLAGPESQQVIATVLLLNYGGNLNPKNGLGPTI